MALGSLTALTAVVYSVFSFYLNYTFHTGSYDLVIFDQAVRSYSHFQPGISIVKGVHNGFGPHFSVLGDHWSPIIATLAPFYWLFNTPDVLLIAQPVLFALAIPPLWVFTRRAFGGGPKATAAAYLVAVAYALSWPIAEASRATFHEVAFAPVLTAIALERLQAGRLRPALLALAGLCLVKEDMGLLIAGIGASLLVSPTRLVPRQRLVGAALIVGGALDTWLTVFVLIPAFGGRSGYYWAYTGLGNNFTHAALHALANPGLALHLLITPHVKLYTMLWLFGAFCFLPLLSPISLAVAPLLLERMLGSKFPNWWTTAHQYNAFLVVILACGAVDGAARLARWTTGARRSAARQSAPGAGALPGTGSSLAAPVAAQAMPGGSPAITAQPATVQPATVQPATVQPATVQPATVQPATAQPPASRAFPAAAQSVAVACAAAMCLVSLALVPRFALGQALQPSFYRRNAQMKAAAEAVALIPSGVTVEAVSNIGPHLSARDTVLLWDEQGPRWAPWVVAGVNRRTFTFKSLRAQKRRVALLKRSGYQVVFDREGYIVLHRVGGRTVTGPSHGVAG